MQVYPKEKRLPKNPKPIAVAKTVTVEKVDPVAFMKTAKPALKKARAERRLRPPKSASTGIGKRMRGEPIITRGLGKRMRGVTTTETEPVTVALPEGWGNPQPPHSQPFAALAHITL